MNAHIRIIAALVMKDIVLIFRNKLFLLITIFGTTAYLVIYFVMPTTVNESLKIGLYSDTPTVPPVFAQLIAGEQEGLQVDELNSDQALRDAVDDGQYLAGIALPADMLTSDDPQIQIYARSDTPAEVTQQLEFMVTELAYLQANQLPVTSQTVLGTDFLGAQIPMRNQMRAILPAILIIAQLFGLATLISEEFEGHTVRAVLVSPANIVDFFVAKGVFGVGMAFGMGMLMMIIIGGMSTQAVIVILTLLLASLVITGIGFIAGAFSKDNMSAVSWSFVIMMALLMPTMTALAPGAASVWVKLIPSYYFSDTLHRASNYGMGISDLWSNLLIMTVFAAAFLTLGILALRRKTR
jgi:ABC-2 type transport system permease protein